jgi:hypothetical protein
MSRDAYAAMDAGLGEPAADGASGCSTPNRSTPQSSFSSSQSVTSPWPLLRLLAVASPANSAAIIVPEFVWEEKFRASRSQTSAVMKAERSSRCSRQPITPSGVVTAGRKVDHSRRWKSGPHGVGSAG